MTMSGIQRTTYTDLRKRIGCLLIEELAVKQRYLRIRVTNCIYVVCHRADPTQRRLAIKLTNITHILFLGIGRGKHVATGGKDALAVGIHPKISAHSIVTVIGRIVQISDRTAGYIILFDIRGR